MRLDDSVHKSMRAELYIVMGADVLLESPWLFRKVLGVIKHFYFNQSHLMHSSHFLQSDLFKMF